MSTIIKADCLEVILKQLPLDDKDQIIIQLSHKFELDKLQLQQEPIHKLALEQQKHSYEMKLCKEKHNHQYEMLKKELMTVNWNDLKFLEQVYIKSFIDLFDGKKLDSKIKEREKRFEEFAQINFETLKEWNLTIDCFTEMFMPFYNKLCLSVYPQFDIGEVCEIKESHLEPNEIKLLGFLWDMFPLPPDKLQLKTLDNNLESVFEKYKK